MPKTKSMIEREKRETREKLKKSRVSAIEVIGVNVAKPPPKYKVKRTSSGKSIEIYQEKE